MRCSLLHFALINPNSQKTDFLSSKGRMKFSLNSIQKLYEYQPIFSFPMLTLPRMTALCPKLNPDGPFIYLVLYWIPQCKLITIITVAGLLLQLVIGKPVPGLAIQPSLTLGQFSILTHEALGQPNTQTEQTDDKSHVDFVHQVILTMKGSGDRQALFQS